MRTPTPALSDRMKAAAAAHALRTGSPVAQSLALARTGALTVDGRLKFKGGPAPAKGEKRQRFEATTEELAAFRKRDRTARYVDLLKDNFGFYIIGQGRRSNSYPTVGQIPVSVIRDFAG